MLFACMRGLNAGSMNLVVMCVHASLPWLARPQLRCHHACCCAAAGTRRGVAAAVRRSCGALLPALHLPAPGARRRRRREPAAAAAIHQPQRRGPATGERCSAFHCSSCAAPPFAVAAAPALRAQGRACAGCWQPAANAAVADARLAWLPPRVAHCSACSWLSLTRLAAACWSCTSCRPTWQRWRAQRQHSQTWRCGAARGAFRAAYCMLHCELRCV